MHWLDALGHAAKEGSAHVLITVLSVVGSVPRASGAKMVVTATAAHDTIGGGNLEFQAIAQAREYLQLRSRQSQQREFTLGSDLSQCCGGRVRLLFEVFPSPLLNVALFGAGHVGSAVAQILSDIDCSLNWFDQRADYLQGKQNARNIRRHVFVHPYLAVESCAPGTSFLILTHSHEIDFELVEATLSRDDVAFCGLIASNSKAAKFRNRLRRKGFSAQEICRLIAPVGSNAGQHKEPMAVAVAIVSQLLEFTATSTSQDKSSLHAIDRM